MGQPYTIGFGVWSPDLNNVATPVGSPYGAQEVPCADVLNVYYVNGSYQSLPSLQPLNSYSLPGAVLGAFTAIDPVGAPNVFGGTNGKLYVFGASSSQIATGFNAQQWVFAQFGSNVYALGNSPLASDKMQQIQLGGFSSTVSAVSAAPVGAVIATVGQFLMVGDVQVQSASAYSLGTGDGTTKIFNGTVPNAPLKPQSIEPMNNGLTLGPDDGVGRFSYSGYVGTINYDTGAISVNYATAPSNGAPITVIYTQEFSTRCQWSAIGNPTSWPTPLTDAAIAAQSGINDLESEFGPIKFIAGYPLYGLVFQNQAITRASYIGGNVVFSWQTYNRKQGLLVRGAAVQVQNYVYFLSDAGFFYTDGANTNPIGTAQDNSAGIDGWFWSNVNKNALSTIRAGYDARKRCVFWSIPTGTNTLPDTLLIFNILAGKWTKAAVPTELIWTDNSGGQEQLGAFNQAHYYSLLNGPTVAGYLETCDLNFTDGNIRLTLGVRPNVDCIDIPTVVIGNRQSLSAAITYSNPTTPDPITNIAPSLSQGLYTRMRITSANAQSFHSGTIFLQKGGQV